MGHGEPLTALSKEAREAPKTLFQARRSGEEAERGAAEGTVRRVRVTKPREVLRKQPPAAGLETASRHPGLEIQGEEPGAIRLEAAGIARGRSGVSQALSALSRDEELAIPLRGPEVEVRVAATPEEYEAAFRVAYEVYYPLGYTRFDPEGMRVTAHQLRSSALVLLALRSGRSLATLSVYSDGPEGLPLDAGWRRDLDRLRGTGARLFECGALMVRPHSGSGAADYSMCLSLFRLAWLFVCREPRACFCASIQARHAFFYERVLGFRRLGPPRLQNWNGLNIPDVLPLALDLASAEDEFRARYEPLGTSKRNLYRFFCEEGRQTAEPHLREGLRLRRDLDFEGLGRRFSTYCPGQTTQPHSV